ncbi:MAG: hypothetical protein EXR93_03150 [Gemmatimonadetes bacterium]|nr:hypothetical protein [Gemmatimonadota bacterium]
MASASFFLAVQERRSARSLLDLVLTRASAEGSADSILAFWNTLAYNAIPLSDSLRVQVPAGGGLRTSVVVIRLADSLFLILTESFKRLARQQVTVIIRLAAARCGEPIMNHMQYSKRCA